MGLIRRRWLVIALWLPLYAAALSVLSTVIVAALGQRDWTAYDWSRFPGKVAGGFGSGEWWGVVGLPTLVVVASQVIFLVPLFAKRPPRGERSRPLLVSLLVGGGVATALTLALALAVVEAISGLAGSAGAGDWAVTASILALVAGSWCFWSGLLLVFARDIWADRLLGRVVGMLLAGTVLELLVVVPLDIMVRRRSDCYCWSETYVAMCISAAVVLWLAGPGVVIALCSRRHRMWRETHCERCGYAKGPSPGATCPECGLAWAGRAAPASGGPSGAPASASPSAAALEPAPARATAGAGEKGDRRDSNP